MKTFKWMGMWCAFLTGIAVWSVAIGATQDVTNTRLYVLDCGHAGFKDMGMFSDTGEYDGRPGAVADPCFLIRHPKGTLLWDTGLGDKLAETKGGSDHDGVHTQLDVSLLETQDGRLRVVDHSGDNFLGGKDMDNVLVDWAVGELSRERNLPKLRRHGAGNGQQHQRAQLAK